MGFLYRKPYWNFLLTLAMMFVGWHALYIWVYTGLMNEQFLLGDDASVALLTGFFGVAGLLLGASKTLAEGGNEGPVKGRGLLPNYLFVMGLVTIMTAEVITMSSHAFYHGFIDLKGVVIGMVIGGVFGILMNMVTTAVLLIKDEKGSVG